jgi:hypothetical protein
VPKFGGATATVLHGVNKITRPLKEDREAWRRAGADHAHQARPLTSAWEPVDEWQWSLPSTEIRR